MRQTDQKMKGLNEKSSEVVNPTNETLSNKEDITDPQFDDLDSGWAWIVLAGSFGTFCLMGATQFASGIIHMILLEKYQASVSLTSIAGAVHMSLISIGSPLSTYVIERYSCRTAISACGCLFFLGYFGTAFAPNIECVIFTYGVVAGIGGSLGYTASMVVIGYNFQKRRNIAMGIAVSGAGIGITFLTPLMHFLYKEYGSFGFFLLISALFAQCVVFGMLSIPSKFELYTKSRRIEQNRDKKIKEHLSILKNKAVLFLSLGWFSFCLGTYLVYLHLPSYIVEKGFSPEVAANLVSLSGLSTVVGRLLTGTVATFRFIRDDILYCLPMFILGAMTIVYPYISTSFAGNVFIALCLGSFYGNVYVLTASVSVKHVGILNLAKAIGIQYFFAGLGVLLGPIMAGIVVDSGGTYDYSFYTAGAFLLLAGITSGMASFVSKFESTGTENKDVEEISVTHSSNEKNEIHGIENKIYIEIF